MIKFCTMVKSHYWELLPSGVGLPSQLLKAFYYLGLKLGVVHWLRFVYFTFAVVNGNKCV